jgi:hypothetical protein
LLTAGWLVATAPLASAQATQPSPSPAAPVVADQVALGASDVMAMEILAAEQQSSAASMTPEQLAAAVEEYFTNGAQATAMPTSGPAAAYFANGAEAMAVPTSGPWAAYYQNGASVMAAPTNAIPEPQFDMSSTGAARATSTAAQNATGATNATSGTASASSAISAPVSAASAASAQPPTGAIPASFPATSSVATSSADQASAPTVPSASADGVREAMPDNSQSQTIAQAIENAWLVANEVPAPAAATAAPVPPATTSASSNESTSPGRSQEALVAQVHVEQADSASAPPTARVRSRRVGWVPIFLGGIGIGALLVALGVRLRPSTRAPAARRS